MSRHSVLLIGILSLTGIILSLILLSNVDHRDHWTVSSLPTHFPTIEEISPYTDSLVTIEIEDGKGNIAYGLIYSIEDGKQSEYASKLIKGDTVQLVEKNLKNSSKHLSQRIYWATNHDYLRPIHLLRKRSAPLTSNSNYYQLPPQLDTVTIGDSRSLVGITPSAIHCYNLSLHSAGLNTLMLVSELIAKEHAVNLWVVGLSYRIFNQDFTDIVYPKITEAGSTSELLHTLLIDPEMTTAKRWKPKESTADHTAKRIDMWNRSRRLREQSPLSDKRLESFEEWIVKLASNGKVIIVVPPILGNQHDGLEAYDDSGTSWESVEKIRQRLSSIAKENVNCIFSDIDQTHEELFHPLLFADADHLNEQGAELLSELVSKLIQRFESPAIRTQRANETRK